MNTKKINLKKAFVCLLSAFCLLGAFPVCHVSAQSQVNGGAPIKGENDYSIREDVMVKKLKMKRSQLTESQKKDLDAKIKILEEEKNPLKAEKSVYGSSQNGDDDELVSTETIYPARKLDMKSCRQVEPFYCGPATVKQTLQYITKKSYSQREIAKDLHTTEAGTEAKYIVPYLNSKQNKVFFTTSTTTSTAKLKKRICHDITVANTPSIARIIFRKVKEGNWPYSSKGHYLNISGYSRGMKKVELTDPNMKNVKKNHKTGKYGVTFTELRNALVEHPDHHLYW